ncbi:MAG: type III secretion system inner membrane ring subunit SctD [Puniceicoccales bacterium]|jgi:type III secretion system YscD/HrpQ family protein|nr:type III secretion system inner membrane ring subunit SctD [Puniceicoccales bacterium]
MAYTLKVLSGPHQGVEVDLNAPLVVGSSQDCDLILADSLLQPQHFSFLLKGEEVWVHPIAGKVFVDGHIVKEDVLVKIFQFITVGTTHFIFGPSQEQWPEISLNDAPLLTESAEEAKEEKPDASAEETSAASQAEAKPRRKASRLGIALLGLFSLLLVALVVYASVTPSKTAKGAATLASVQRLIRSELELLGWKDEVRIKAGKGGKLSLKGYVPTNADLAALKDKIFAVDRSVQMKVYSTERILQQGSDVFVAAKIKVKLRETQPGNFVVEGYVFGADQWEKIRTHLLGEVAGLKDLQDRVTTSIKALTTGRIILTKYKLSNSVGIFPKEENVVVSGTIAQSEKSRWEDARTELQKIFTEAVPLQFFVTMAIAESGADGNAPRHYFEAEVLSVVTKEGGLSRIELRNGKKYFEGSDLPNGYVVDKIEPELITLSRAGNEVVLRKGEY